MSYRVETNRSRQPHGGFRRLDHLIAEQAARTPSATAVVFRNDHLTYDELDRRSNRFAHLLRARGIGRTDLVAVQLDRRLDFIAVLVGILKAGAAYVPIDARSPAARRDFILAQTKAKLLISTADLVYSAPIAGLDIDSDDTWRPFSDEPARAPAHPEDLLYVLYTSGSTGEPKGVAVQHDSICNLLTWMVGEYGRSVGDRLFQRTPYTFDASVWEIFLPLTTGGTVVLAEPGQQFDPAYVVDAVARLGITTLQVVPSFLRHLLDEPGLASCRTLRHVFCGGEPLTPELRDRFLSSHSIPLHNLYGPTEASVQVMTHTCSPIDPRDHVPIGRPIANVTARVLDPAGRPVGAGGAGELYLGGVAVARGYLGDPQRTAESFVELPEPHGGGGSRFYRTGDTVRQHQDGAFEFLGRTDEQVKVHGYRIELGEIEAQLLLFPGVRAAAVVPERSERSGGTRLVAYLEASGTVHLPKLLDHLATSLPEYMIPTQVKLVDRFPLSAHGKLDKTALPKVHARSLTQSSNHAAAKTDVEAKLVAIWSRILGVAVGVDDDFFELGGDSMAGLMAVNDAKKLGIDLRPADLSILRRISAIAAHRGASVAVPPISFGVVGTYPHDTEAFTQGLVARDGQFYESTGQRGHSEVRIVEIATGRLLKRHSLDDRYFGEGLAELGGKLYQLTYQEKQCFVYDMRDLSPLGEFEISTEGWGLATLGRNLVLSDGTATLYTVDPAEGTQRPLVEVTENGASLSGLNELEVIDGFIYANVYPTARIVKVDPTNGQVVGWIDLSGLLADQSPNASVPNGIAHDPVQRRTFVTGKHWSAVHEIKLS